MSDGKQGIPMTTPQNLEPSPPAYPAQPAPGFPGETPSFPGPQQSYPSQPSFPQQQSYSGQPQSAVTTPPVAPQLDAATSAALAGQQYRDQLFAQCAQGNHERTTTYGMCGIITAILCFPCGLICLFTDTEEKCARCGVNLEKR